MEIMQNQNKSLNKLNQLVMSRGNTNAKQEFVRALREKNPKCAEIVYTACSLWAMGDEDGPEPKKLFLRVGHTWEEFEEFLNQLDFDYDSGYGGQELFGTVWFHDGTWMGRGEYDGSEWWEHYMMPQIPEHLNKPY